VTPIARKRTRSTPGYSHKPNLNPHRYKNNDYSKIKFAALPTFFTLRNFYIWPTHIRQSRQQQQQEAGTTRINLSCSTAQKIIAHNIDENTYNYAPPNTARSDFNPSRTGEPLCRITTNSIFVVEMLTKLYHR